MFSIHFLTWPQPATPSPSLPQTITQILTVTQLSKCPKVVSCDKPHSTWPDCITSSNSIVAKPLHPPPAPGSPVWCHSNSRAFHSNIKDPPPYFTGRMWYFLPVHCFFQWTNTSLVGVAKELYFSCHMTKAKSKTSNPPKKQKKKIYFFLPKSVVLKTGALNDGSPLIISHVKITVDDTTDNKWCLYHCRRHHW